MFFEIFVRLNLFSGSAHRKSQHLVGEGVAHDEGWMSHGTSQVDQSAFSQDDDVVAVFQQEAVDLRRRRHQLRLMWQRRAKEIALESLFFLKSHLRLDVDFGFSVFVQPAHVDFTVEVSDVTDDSIILHVLKVAAGKTCDLSCLNILKLIIKKTKNKTSTPSSSYLKEAYRPRMMSSQPVVVTKMFPSLQASSMVVTS